MVNDARLEIFLKKYKPNTRGAVISCVKKIDSSSLPSCSRVIKERIKNCGWVLQNDTFKNKWFEGDMSPITVKMICTENENDISSRTECDNFCNGMVLEKETDHHEDSDDEFHYDYDDDNFNDSDLSESEANSNDDNQ